MTLAARRVGFALLAASAAWLAVSALAAHLVSRRPRAPYDEPLPAVEWAAVEPVALEAADGDVVVGLDLVHLLRMRRALPNRTSSPTCARNGKQQSAWPHPQVCLRSLSPRRCGSP